MKVRIAIAVAAIVGASCIPAPPSSFAASSVRSHATPTPSRRVASVRSSPTATPIPSTNSDLYYAVRDVLGELPELDQVNHVGGWYVRDGANAVTVEFFGLGWQSTPHGQRVPSRLDNLRLYSEALHDAGVRCAIVPAARRPVVVEHVECPR